ncbi:MAG: hypothetical protein KAI14_05320, partial [Dehalococcoidales bacterium]|nr:hypothetical protein [Dehalococcoidales bacterium]
SEQRDYGDKIADLIDEEVHNIIQQAHETARDMLSKNKQKLTSLAEKLITRETLEGKELEAIFNEIVPAPQPEPTKATARKSATDEPNKSKQKKAPKLVRQPKLGPATP